MKLSYPMRAFPRRKRRDVYSDGWGTYQRCGLLRVVRRFPHITRFLRNGFAVGEFNAAFPYHTASLRRNGRREENTVKLHRQKRTCTENVAINYISRCWSCELYRLYIEKHFQSSYDLLVSFSVGKAEIHLKLNAG